MTKKFEVDWPTQLSESWVGKKESGNTCHELNVPIASTPP